MSSFTEYLEFSERAARYGGPERYLDGIKSDYYDCGYEAGHDDGYSQGSEEAYGDGLKVGNRDGLLKGILLTAAICAPVAIAKLIYDYQSDVVRGMEFEVLKDSYDEKSGLKVSKGDCFTVLDVGNVRKWNWKKTRIYVNRDSAKTYEVGSGFLGRISEYGKYFLV